MSLAINSMTVSNRWGLEVDPVVWQKSSILDEVTVALDVTASASIFSGEVFFNVAMFREVGTPYTGNTRPSRGFYAAVPAAPGVVGLVETGISAINSNFLGGTLTMVSSTNFVVEFTVRMLADRNDFFNGVLMDTIDQLLKNSVDNGAQLDNTVPSVYNKVKELQVYLYAAEAGGTEHTELVRQQWQAKFYGEHGAFEWYTELEDFCALHGNNEFEFEFDPAQASMDANYYRLLFNNVGLNVDNYVADLELTEVLKTNGTVSGGLYSDTFEDYNGKYYTAIVYNIAGVSYAQILGPLVSECLPEQPPIGVHGHIKDYMGGESSLGQPCAPTITPVNSTSGYLETWWWRPFNNMSSPIAFFGGLEDIYPGHGLYSGYSGTWPVDGYLQEWYVSLLGTWQAKASPTSIFHWQWDANAATQAANFATMINTYFFASWSAVIDSGDNRIVHMTKVNPTGRASSFYGLAYKHGATPAALSYYDVLGTDQSMFIIDDVPNDLFTVITWDDVPNNDNLGALISYINNDTIYSATLDGGGLIVCMPLGSYDALDVADSSVELISQQVPPVADNVESFEGGESDKEDYTEQVVTERLKAVAVIEKEVYEGYGGDGFGSVEGDLRKVRIMIGGKTVTAVRTGSAWLTTNSKLSITEDDDQLVAEYSFRGLFENEQAIEDWAETTQDIVWEFEFSYTEPTVYTRIHQYYQKVDFSGFDVGGGGAGEVINGLVLSKTGGGTVNSLCDIEEVFLQAQTVGSLPMPDDYKLVVLIDAEPYGVTLLSEQSVEEEDEWIGELEQLSTNKLTVTLSQFTAGVANATVHIVQLLNRRYRLTALAYDQQSPPPNHLLDVLMGADLAYSVRRIRSVAVNPMRVYEDGGATEEDQVFDVDVLDEVELLAHTGANNGFLANWYDQSGNAVHQGVTAAVLQPPIVLGGTVIKFGGIPAVRFLAGGSIRMEAAYSVAQPFTLFAVIRTANDFAANRSVASFDNDSSGLLLRNTTGAQLRCNLGSNITHSATLTTNTNYFMYFLADGANSELGINGAAAESGDAGTNGCTAKLTLGTRNGGFDQWEGHIYEFIIFPGDRSADYLTAWANANGYYNIIP